MKVFDSTTSIGKMFKHIFNLIVLAALFAGGYKFGVSHAPNDSPYMYAYALPSGRWTTHRHRPMRHRGKATC